MSGVCLFQAEQLVCHNIKTGNCAHAMNATCKPGHQLVSEVLMVGLASKNLLSLAGWSVMTPVTPLLKAFSYSASELSTHT